MYVAAGSSGRVSLYGNAGLRVPLLVPLFTTSTRDLILRPIAVEIPKRGPTFPPRPEDRARRFPNLWWVPPELLDEAARPDAGRVGIRPIVPQGCK